MKWQQDIQKKLAVFLNSDIFFGVQILIQLRGYQSKAINAKDYQEYI